MRDGIGGAVHIGVEIEACFVVPCMTRKNGQRPEGQNVVQLNTCGSEDVIEHPAHGEHGRPRIDRRAIHGGRAQLSAGALGAFEHNHALATAGEQQCCGEAAHSGADDYDGPFQHRLPDPLITPGKCVKFN